MKYEAVNAILEKINVDNLKYICFVTTVDNFEYSRYDYCDYGYKREIKIFDEIDWNPAFVCVRIRSTLECIDIDKIVAIKYRLFEEDE